MIKTFQMFQPEGLPIFDLDFAIDFQSSDDKYPEFPPTDNQATSLTMDRNICLFSTIGKRKSNLDTMDYLIRPNLTMIAVFDGHGSSEVSNYLKSHLLRKICSHHLFQEDCQVAIREVFELVQELIVGKFQKGSTATVVVCKKQNFVVANLGDSKVFGVNEQGQLEPFTEEHNLSNQAELKEVIKNGGYIFKRGSQYRINGELNLSRSFGDSHYKSCMSSKPEIHTFPIDQLRCLIVATDGLYKNSKFKAMSMNPYKISKDMSHLSFSDNATAIFLSLTQ